MRLCSGGTAWSHCNGAHTANGYRRDKGMLSTAPRTLSHRREIRGEVAGQTKFPRSGSSQDQHGVAKAVETVSLPDGFLVGTVNQVFAGKGGHQHEQG